MSLPVEVETHDMVPVRLPSGGKAYLWLPDPLTKADAEHLAKWIESYITEESTLEAVREVSI